MLPSPGIYSGPFPPRDPRIPSLGRNPEIVGGSNIAHEAMAAYHERSAPLREIAYARTGRDAATQASPETGEMASGPDDYHEEPEGPSALEGAASGAAAGARHFYHASKFVGYGLGALSGAVTGLAYGGVKGLVNGSLRHESESDEEPARPEPRPAPEPKPQEAIPAYLQDREEVGRPRKFMSMLQKERTRYREQAAMDGEHPFHPWRK